MTRFKDEEGAASRAGKASAAARAEREALRADPEAYVAMTFERERTKLIDELLNAAYGRGRWHDLAPDRRLTALFKALEYATGKPQAGKAVGTAAPDAPEAPQPGLVVS